MRFGYADPPYPGRANLYPERLEVDHRELIGRLLEVFPDGWALSTSSDALAEILGYCVELEAPELRVCAWLRRVRPTSSRRPLSAWEPLVVSGGRLSLEGGLQRATDALECRGRWRSFPGAIVGMKPPPYAVWMFQQLGALPGDELVDIFPGSGAVSLAWARYTSLQGPLDASSAGEGDTSPEVLDDASPATSLDASLQLEATG